LAISIAYLLSVGKAQIINSPQVTWILRGVMVVLILRGLRAEARENHCTIRVDLRPSLQECGAWLLFLAALSLPCLLTFSGRWEYLADGVISTVISFGGGDAYLAVAGGMFVGSGFIYYTDFYSNVVPAANAFPGSILCKVLACTGYLAAYRATGSLLIGYGVALCGFGCSVAVSGCTFSLVYGLYDRVEQMPVFSLLTEVVRPVISGLMLSVALSIYYTCINTGSMARWPDLCAPVLCVALAVGCAFFVKRFGQRPLRMVIACALLSLLSCNLFSIF
jgi:chromate transporter